MRIGPKVGLLVGGLLVANGATVGVSALLLNQNQVENTTLVNQALLNVDYTTRIKDAYQAQSIAWDQIMLNAKDITRLNKSIDDFTVAAQKVESLTSALDKEANQASVKDAVQAFIDVERTVTPEQLAEIPRIMTTAKSGQAHLANRMSQTHSQQGLELAAVPLTRSNDLTKQAMADQRDASRRELGLTAGIMSALLGAMVIAAVMMTRRIVGPIRSMISGAIDAADNRLPAAVRTVRQAEGDVQAPELTRFQAQTKDELAQLAGALNQLQDSAIEMAVDVRKAEIVHAETLVNLGRRNQSMLTRTLNYLAELERNERDSDTLAKLFRLDHLTTRIRRNAESMLVLAGAEQSRTHSRPVAVGNVLRASLAEIKHYTRVSVDGLAPATFLGSAAADVAHLVAELLENAAHFSPETTKVHVAGQFDGSDYVIKVTDSGLGMAPVALVEANQGLADGDEDIHDTKVLGHHIVARICARRGITCQLMPSEQGGITAVVSIPSQLLHVSPARVVEAEPESEAELPVQRQSAAPTPRRRVRGAQLGDLADDVDEAPATPRDPKAVRSALSGLQAGVDNARREAAQLHAAEAEATPQPAAEPEPVVAFNQTQGLPARRVRGAQLPDSRVVTWWRR